jgi:hypothetical protein
VSALAVGLAGLLAAPVGCRPAAPPPPALAAAPAGPTVAPGVQDPQLQALVYGARRSASTFERLAALCDGVGPRLAGSPAMVAAEAWGLDLFQKDGQEGIAAEPVLVPVWIRGDERVEILAPWPAPLQALALGGSPGTSEPVEADVVVVRRVEDLGPEVAGKIVLFQTVMPETEPATGGYGAAVRARGQGPAAAAAAGAVGALVRSMTTRSLGTPHTGGTSAPADGVRAIPSVAVSTENADMITRLVEDGVTVRVRLALGASTAPDATGHNIVAEVRGAELPGEVVLIGGHLDSWDVGQGAHDDGAGVVESIEALRLIRQLGVRPRRTVRAVLFANEENGLRGGVAYAEAHAAERHVAAIESDLGGGWPLGFSATGTPEQLAWLRAAAAPLGLPIGEGGGGADIGPLKGQGTLLIGLRPDDRHYFDVHHTHADTLDKVDPASLREATAALAGLAWLLANAPPAPVQSPEP